MIFDHRIPASAATNEGDVLRFRFSPRDAKVWAYVIESNFAGLEGTSGKFTAIPPPIGRTGEPSAVHPHWWIDDPDPAVAEGVHPGAKSVNQWREDFLRDFAERMDAAGRLLARKTSHPERNLTLYGTNPMNTDSIILALLIAVSGTRHQCH